MDNFPWIQNAAGDYSVEASSLSDSTCPHCKESILQDHFSRWEMDKTNEDVVAYHYIHSCGVKLVILND